MFNQSLTPMKKILYSSMLILMSVCLFSCGSESGKTNLGAVCIWDRVSLYDAPSDKAKWLTAVSLGEKVTFLNETAIDSAVSKPVEYLKIKLLDGKTGWVRTDFVVLDARPAVFINDANYYNRPDLMTKSNNTFSLMDIVAVKGDQDGWVEIKGKRSKGSWIETGWIKPENLSFEEVDLAVAKFTIAALALKDEAKKLEALNEIAANPDFSSSVFMQLVQEKIYELQPDEEYEDYYDEGDSIEVVE